MYITVVVLIQEATWQLSFEYPLCQSVSPSFTTENVLHKVEYIGACVAEKSDGR